MKTPKHQHTTTTPRRWWRRLRQDLRVLARLFPWQAGGALAVGIAVMALIFQQTYNRGGVNGATPLSYVKAVYAILNMMAFQVSFADMPEGPALDAFFVVVPVIGIPLLLVFGASILTVLRIFFVRGERGQLWQEALAATVEHPIVVCGLGRVGYRIASRLLDLGQPVVGIDTTSSPLVAALIERDMPYIAGDIHDQEVLRRAGVARAETVLVCTDQDLVNIEAVSHVRELNPDARVVLRLFEDQIADEIQATFDVKAVISRSAVAAVAFAHAAIGMEVVETFNFNAQTYFLTKLSLNVTSPFAGSTLGAVADQSDVTVVCLYREGRTFIEPGPDTLLRVGDTLFAFTEMSRASALARQQITAQQQKTAPLAAGAGPVIAPGPVIVCGIKHTGYRVVNNLLALNHPVVAMDFEPDELAEQLRRRGVPIIYGNFRQHATLEQAGIRDATAIIACTEDDMVNFETALRARELNPSIRVVMRIFEESLGERLQHAFNIDAVYSTSAIAAPAFISAALDTHLVHEVDVGDAQFRIARLMVASGSRLHRATIADLNREDDLTVLLHARMDDIHIPPDPDAALAPGDEIIVLASQAKLHEIGLKRET